MSDWAKGGFIHEGAFTRQNPKVLEVFPQFFAEHQFDLVIEFGSDEGGMSMLLQDECDRMGARFETYEIRDFTPQLFNDNPHCRQRCISLNICDVFAQETFGSVAEMMVGRTLILCDGGDKAREVNLYSALLKRGDVIMAHDYAPSEQVFWECYYGKIWDWLEITERDIADACAAYGLVDFYPAFHTVAWACKIKE